MKHTSIKLLAIAGLILQGCAGTVNPTANASQKLLEGSEKIALSQKDCPRGLGMVHLYKDTLDGNKTKFNAKFALTSAPITQDLNVYSLIGETAPEKGKKASKVDVDSTYNSIVIKLSEKPAEEVRALSGEEVHLNEPIAIRFNPKAGYYENWGPIAGAALSEADQDGRAVIQSLTVKLSKDDKEGHVFQIPGSIDSADLEHPLNQKFSGTIGEPLTIKINPKEEDVDGTVLVQLANGKKGAEGLTYNYLVKEKPAQAEISIPTKEIAAGNYALNLFRSEVYPVDMGEKQNFCMEISTGVMGTVSIKEPEKK